MAATCLMDIQASGANLSPKTHKKKPRKEISLFPKNVMMSLLSRSLCMLSAPGWISLLNLFRTFELQDRNRKANKEKPNDRILGRKKTVSSPHKIYI